MGRDPADVVANAVRFGPLARPLAEAGPDAAARRPRVLGSAKIAAACSSVTVNSSSSDPSDRESVPFFR